MDNQNNHSSSFRRDITRLQEQYQKIIERLDLLKEEVTLHRYKVIEAIAEIQSIYKIQRSDFDALAKEMSKMATLEAKFKEIYASTASNSNIRLIKLEEIKKYNKRLLIWAVLLLGTVSFFISLVMNWLRI